MAYDFSIKAFFGGDTTQLRAAADDARGTIATFAKNSQAILGEVGASFLAAFSITAVVQKLISSTSEIMAHVRELRNMSREYETSTEHIQAFEAVVVKLGGSQEDANKAWSRARLSLDQLMIGATGATDAFAKIGLSAKDFVGLGLDESLEKIARAYSENTDKAGAYAAMAEIFGARTIPRLNDALIMLGQKGIQGLTDSMKAMGKVFDEDAVASLDTFKRSAGGVYAFLETGFVNWLGHVVGGFRMIGQITGATFAAMVNDFEGLKTSDEDYVNTVLAGVEKTTTGQKKHTAEIGETSKAQAEHAKEAAKTNDEYSKLMAKASDLNTQTRRDALPLAKQIKELESERLGIIQDQEQTIKGSVTYAESIVELARVDAELAKAKISYEKEIEKEYGIQLRAWIVKNDEAKKAKDAAAAEAAAQEGVTAELDKQVVAWGKINGVIPKVKGEIITLQGLIAGVGTSKNFGNESTEVLQERYRRDNEDAVKLQYLVFARGSWSDDTELARVKLEMQNISKELGLRQEIKGIYDRNGYQAALRAFPGDPGSFDSFLAIITKTNTAQDKTNILLDRISNVVRTALT